MTRPGGPMEAGGFEEYILDDDSSGEGYTIRLYPDLWNEELQREGQAAQFYWTPQSLRIARFPDTNRAKYSHTHFRGLFDESNVGVDEKSETVGGLLNFTVTSRLPARIMAQLREQILEKRRADDRPFWRWFGNREPNITMVPIRGNTASISSLAPDSPGAQIHNDPGTDGGVDTGAPGDSIERDLITDRGVRHNQDLRSTSSLDLWAVQLDGLGAGSITGGENAYGGLLGGIPSELVWAAMQGNASPFFVSQTLLIPMATPVVEMKIHFDANMTHDHFSAAASANYIWASAEISYQLETLRRKGHFEVTMTVDQTLPGAKAIQERLEKTKDLVREQFMKAAMNTIFQPVPPVEAAQAPKSKGWWGVGASVKLVKKREFVTLDYTETQIWKYNRQDVISSTLEGLRREITADPDAARHYFHLVNLGELNKKRRHFVSPIGLEDPVHAMHVEFGYPLTDGTLQWKGEQFTLAGGENQVWEPEWVQLRDGEVTNPPADWTPDQSFMRRRVSLGEGTSALEDPHNRVIVEVNQVNLDPGANGRLVKDIGVEVRADRDGVFELGPIQLDTVLDGNSQVVEVEIWPDGKTLENDERDVIRFSFNGIDQNEPRTIKIFTGDPTFNPSYQYRTRVIVKGSLTGGSGWVWPESWEPDEHWLPGLGSGPVTLTVSKPGTEAGSRMRPLRRDEILSTSPQSEDGVGGQERDVPGAQRARRDMVSGNKRGSASTYNIGRKESPPPPEIIDHGG